MPDPLPDLEADRAKLFQQMQTLGDFRPGSISVVVRRCGKPICHCAQPDDPGHDPQFRLTRKVDGKTVTESFPTPAAFRKAQREVTGFHRFQTLSADLLAVNEKICRLRPVEPEQGGWTPQEKKRLLRSIRRSPEK
ncbi:MAG: DUF6788 family protein [Burkholderiales bacterium]